MILNAPGSKNPNAINVLHIAINGKLYLILANYDDASMNKYDLSTNV